ncbi:MAG TPA: DUF4199 domain-containing protein [Lacibacter sp.]|nr:DUF4199 domain-containing protein [Lacibacter sp.]HMO89699.1 DUF4199 domain-containing protein [Lacibacter sp.]HMP88319.1 DUF4199 domain-containing protein [Lacibacter sp.]
METKPANYLLQYGLISGAAGIVTYLVLYLGGAEWMTSPAAFATSLVPIIFAVLGVLAVRKSNGGFIDFGDALKNSFGIFVIGGLMVTLFSYLLINFIDPDFKQAMQQASMEMTEKMLKRFNLPQDQIDKAVEEATKKDNFSIGNVLLGFAFTCFLWFLFSLIIALILKKKNPNAGMPQTL